MKVSFQIMKHGEPNTQLINTYEHLDLNIEYAIPSDLFIIYKTDKELINNGIFYSYRKFLKKINHLLSGSVKYKDLVFDVTVGVIFHKNEKFHIILSQDSNNGNYHLRQNHFLDADDEGDYQIIDIKEYATIQKLENKKLEVGELFEFSNLSNDYYIISVKENLTIDQERKISDKIKSKEDLIFFNKIMDNPISIADYMEAVKFLKKHQL